MFYKADDDGFVPVLPGIRRKTLVHGEATLFSEFRMDKGSILPDHAHPQEQTGCLVSGRIMLTIGKTCYYAESGDAWCVPPNTQHGAEVIEDAVAIEVFSPVRQDYLPGEE